MIENCKTGRQQGAAVNLILTKSLFFEQSRNAVVAFEDFFALALNGARRLLGLIPILLLLCFLGKSDFATAQCTNTSAFGSASAPVFSLITVETCQFAGEYHEITGCAAATTYISGTDLIGGYYTVRRGTFNGPVVAAGPAPLTWTTTVAGTYFVHLNTSAACGTDFACHVTTIQHVCNTPSPTAISANPASVCANTTCNLNATSAGNTIQWFTMPSGGASIGSSASGANFSVLPTFTGNYYAAANNGTCTGPRIPVLVTVTPSPTITSLIATPDTVCVGDLANLVGNSCGSVSGFSGIYAPANWTTTHSPITDVGIVYPGGAPNSIAIESSNGGNFGIHSVLYTTTIPCNGLVSFNWSYFTTDIDGSDYDYPEYAVNGVNQGYLPGFVAGGPVSQSGTFNMGFTAGQTFSLIMTASDDVLGPATTTYTNFAAPGGLGIATFNWFTVPVGGVSLGSSGSGNNFPVTPGATTTYYAQASYNGCSSARMPLQVVVEGCILPTDQVVLAGFTEEGSHHLHWDVEVDAFEGGFNLQRSDNGADFETIAQLESGELIGDRMQFSYNEQNPKAGLQIYRLAFLDDNGEIGFSNQVLLRFDPDKIVFGFAPNPTKDEVFYLFDAAAPEEILLEVYDVFGRMVLQDQASLKLGSNRIPISMKALAPGAYFVNARHLENGILNRAKVLRQ